MEDGFSVVDRLDSYRATTDDRGKR